MIKVTCLDGKFMMLNANLIESVEVVPETVITLTNGKKILVKETPAELVARVMRYYRGIFSGRRLYYSR